jgi:hypothetical protein
MDLRTIKFFVKVMSLYLSDAIGHSKKALN